MKHTLIVAFCTQDSCAAYATPRSRGRLYQESGPDGKKCISESNAMRMEVFPDPVPPRIKLMAPRLKTSSPSIFNKKFRFEVFPWLDQPKVALRKPSMSWLVVVVGNTASSPGVNVSRSSVWSWTSGIKQTMSTWRVLTLYKNSVIRSRETLEYAVLLKLSINMLRVSERRKRNSHP